MIILGLNAYHGDAAAAIIRDGELIAAVEEERFNRIKHCAGFPTESVRYCLATAGIEIEEVEHIGISRDPSAHLHKKILFAATRAVARKGRSGDAEMGGKGEWENGGSGEAGNGRGGVFRQIKDRLQNTAKVRDLQTDLARMLGRPK